MRKIEEVLRLHARGLSTRRIAAASGVGKTTVIEYLRRAGAVGLSWPLPAGLGATTLNDHRPSSHRRYAEVTPQTLRERASRIGPSTAILIDVILRDRPHPEQGFRSCLGILRLARSHGPEPLEAACDRALVINARTMTSVKSILQNRLDGRRPEEPTEAPPIAHANIRGPQFFH